MIKQINDHVFSLSLINPIKLGMIINNVHHPVKNTFICVTPKALSPKITPNPINTIQDLKKL